MPFENQRYGKSAFEDRTPPSQNSSLLRKLRTIGRPGTRKESRRYYVADPKVSRKCNNLKVERCRISSFLLKLGLSRSNLHWASSGSAPKHVDCLSFSTPIELTSKEQLRANGSGLTAIAASSSLIDSEISPQFSQSVSQGRMCAR